MTKTVHNNDQIRHLWANQTQSYARGNGSTHFEGPTLFSYNTPIAHFVMQKGRRVALITTASYSPSTSRHVPSVRDIPGYPETMAFAVKHIGVSGGRADRLPDDWQRVNYLHMAERYKDLIVRIARAKNDFTLSYLREDATRMRENARRYAEVFGLRFSLDKYFPEVTEAQLAATLEKIKTVKTRDRAKLAAEAKKRDRRIAEFVTGKSDTIAMGDYYACAGNPAQRRGIEQRALELWRAGRGEAHFPLGETRLRVVVQEGVQIIQTSRGAEFPAAHGMRALTLIRNVVKTGTAWERNGKTIHLGSFQIDRIEPDGRVRAGCHTVFYAEIESVAAILEGQPGLRLLDLPGAAEALAQAGAS